MIKTLTGLFYLTRACNLDCEYCLVWDNHFPNELTLEQKKEAIRIMWQDLGLKFLFLFGGEPMMLGDGLTEIIQYCGSLGVDYAVVTNSVLLTPKKARTLVDAGLKNWSVSMDFLPDDLRGQKDPIKAKATKGIRDLLMLKELGVKDLFATLTIMHSNIDQIIPVVDYCNSNGIWTLITALHTNKGEGYYFAQPAEKMQDFLLTDEDWQRLMPILDQLRERKSEGWLIHNDADFFDLYRKHGRHTDWYCEGMGTLVVDADGAIKTCLHYDHLEGRYNVLQFAQQGEFDRFLAAETAPYPCKGCLWDCRVQSEKWVQLDIDQGAMIFNHGA